MVTDARKLTSYPLQAKALYKPNTLILFDDAPDVFVYQPPNDPYLVYGKSVQIISEKQDRWIIQDPKNKKLTIDFLKRPELLRHASQADLIDTFGPEWNKHILKLNALMRSKYTISDKNFTPATDVVYE